MTPDEYSRKERVRLASHSIPYIDVAILTSQNGGISKDAGVKIVELHGKDFRPALSQILHHLRLAREFAACIDGRVVLGCIAIQSIDLTADERILPVTFQLFDFRFRGALLSATRCNRAAHREQQQRDYGQRGNPDQFFHDSGSWTGTDHVWRRRRDELVSDRQQVRVTPPILLHLTIRTRLLSVAFLVSFARCGMAPVAPDLERALVMETHLDVQEAPAGESFLATFTVRNVSPATIVTCIDGDGVSVRLRSPDGKFMFPITSFGIHLHAACPNETRFLPGESKTYRQRLFTLTNFAFDRAIFEATLPLKQHPRFRTGPGETYFTLRSTSEVRVYGFAEH